MTTQEQIEKVKSMTSKLKIFFIGFRGQQNYWSVKAANRKAALAAFFNYHGVVPSDYATIYRNAPAGIPIDGIVAI